MVRVQFELQCLPLHPPFPPSPIALHPPPFFAPTPNPTQQKVKVLIALKDLQKRWQPLSMVREDQVASQAFYPDDSAPAHPPPCWFVYVKAA